MVKVIQNNDISEVKEQAAAIIDFSAVWCGPCKMVAPVVEQLSEELEGKVAFYNVDVDQNSDVAQQFGIMNIPTIVLLKNGEEAARTVGFQPKPQLQAWIESNN